MGHGQKFQDRWEFKRRDGHFDCSSDQPVSTSNLEPILKKHKTVSSLLAPKIEEEKDRGRRLKLKRACVAPLLGDQLQVKNSNDVKNKREETGKKCDGKEGKGKACEPATLADTRILMDSILEELKVAREKMLIWMREQVQKIMHEDTNPESTVGHNCEKHERSTEQHQNSLPSESEVPNSNVNTLAGSTNRKQTLSTLTGNDIPENQSEYCLPTLPPMEPPGDFLSSIKEPSYSTSLSDQDGHSMYLTQQTVLPENQRLNSPPCNFAPKADENIVNLDIGSPNLDSSTCGVTSRAGQNEEKFENVDSLGSVNLICNEQSQLSPSSSFVPGFPIPFRHSFKIQMESCIQSVSGFDDMSRGMEVVAEDHGLSDLYADNNLNHHLSYKGTDDAWSEDNLISSSQRELVMHELLYQE